jgi:small-conductance mechanosensitive channel
VESHSNGILEGTSMKMTRLLLLAAGILLSAMTVPAQTPEPAVKPATFYFQNREIITLRSMRGSYSPAERVDGALRHLGSELREFGPTEVKIVQVDGMVTVMMRTSPIIIVLPGDVDPTLVGDEATVEATAQKAATELNAAVSAWTDERNPAVIARGALYTLLALVLASVAIWLVGRGAGRMTAWLSDKARHQVEGRSAVQAINLLEPALRLLRLFVNLGRFALWAAIAYLWATFSLSNFPTTAPLAGRLTEVLTNSISIVGSGILNGLPSVFMAVLILAITRLVAYAVKSLFDSVSDGRVNIKGIYPDTADAMRRIAVVLVWVFGIAMAFPFIPGSDSDAVKGVSVLFGLMITLGSSGVISQAMSGLVVVFSRAIREDEYVRIGEYEGTITQVGGLSAKLRTPRNEEITIPNSLLVSTPTRNYSRLAGQNGVVLQATVGIGYDAPWREVHDMLIEAANRTEGLKKSPTPFVRQANLSAFSVDYIINAYLEHPEMRLAVLSDLHANIQDIFNEHEIQIMTPAFESQPAEPVLVPKKALAATPSSTNSGTGV